MIYKLPTQITVSLLCLFMGVAVGGITNAINGLISPQYFINILGFHPNANVWLLSINQGVFEGFLYGVVFAIVFTTITVARKGIAFANQQIFVFFTKLASIIFAFWVLGGVMAILLANISPEFYRNAFIGVPFERVEMIRYAWVGGSILGGMIGGLSALVMGSVIFWKKTNG